MSKKLPSEIAETIRELVYQEADLHGYISKSREKNSVFISELAANRKIGGVLSEYIKQPKIRTYIKDAILNKYTKELAKNARPQNYSEIIFSTLGINVDHIDCCKNSGIDLYKSPPSTFVVVSNGSVIKWETSLRKALLYIPEKPFASTEQKNTIHILLTLYAKNRRVSELDKQQIVNALKICNASVHIYGEH
ncbi:MAG: hypothetical protein AB8C13_06760 [Phycisphaerales bacterium]